MDFQKYIQLKEEGKNKEEVYLAAKDDGLLFPVTNRILRELFGLSFVEAKEVEIKADKLASSLSEYQEKILGSLSETDINNLLGN